MYAELPEMFTPYDRPAYYREWEQVYKPDCVVEVPKTIYIIELTVPFETNFDKRHAEKTKKYAELPKRYAPYARGKTIKVLCVEVGARGRLAPSIAAFRELLTRKQLKALKKNMTQAAIRASQLIFHRREDQLWATE